MSHLAWLYLFWVVWRRLLAGMNGRAAHRSFYTALGLWMRSLHDAAPAARTQCHTQRCPWYIHFRSVSIRLPCWIFHFDSNADDCDVVTLTYDSLTTVLFFSCWTFRRHLTLSTIISCLTLIAFLWISASVMLQRAACFVLSLRRSSTSQSISIESVAIH